MSTGYINQGQYIKVSADTIGPSPTPPSPTPTDGDTMYGYTLVSGDVSNSYPMYTALDLTNVPSGTLIVAYQLEYESDLQPRLAKVGMVDTYDLAVTTANGDAYIWDSMQGGSITPINPAPTVDEVIGTLQNASVASLPSWGNSSFIIMPYPDQVGHPNAYMFTSNATELIRYIDEGYYENFSPIDTDNAYYNEIATAYNNGQPGNLTLYKYNQVIAKGLIYTIGSDYEQTGYFARDPLVDYKSNTYTANELVEAVKYEKYNITTGDREYIFFNWGNWEDATIAIHSDNSKSYLVVESGASLTSYKNGIQQWINDGNEFYSQAYDTLVFDHAVTNLYCYDFTDGNTITGKAYFDNINIADASLVMSLKLNDVIEVDTVRHYSSCLSPYIDGTYTMTRNSTYDITIGG